MMSEMTWPHFGCRPLYALALWVLTGQSMGAEIYAYVDKDGNLSVSETKVDARYVRFDPTRRIPSKVISRKTAWVTQQVGPQWPSQAILSNIPIHHKALHYTPLINNIATEIGVNANLLHAIIQVESAYNSAATSPKGAQGLMQLIPATAERFGVVQSYDPEANVRGGARYIKNLLTQFDNNLQLALAAYNAGEGAVQKYNNTIPPYPETQAYVDRVLTVFRQREE